jgi:3-oxoacyl-[acyl-carrier protein] reductase
LKPRKVALITGASQGIGRATAERLAGSGYDLVLAARRPGPLAEVAAVVETLGATVLSVPTDVAREADVTALFAQVGVRFGRLDALVNSAGGGRFANVDETPMADWEAVLGANLTGTFLCCKYALKPMLEQGEGQIVNVLSIAGKVAFPGSGAYCAAKWGALGFTRVLAEEVRRQGIRVTALCPGSVDTTFWEGLAWKPDAARMISPAGVADAIAYLLQQSPNLTTDEWVLMPREGIL